ncbi:MAG: GntR family transcriptional regulator [Actinobacteria bacterium]|nr:GntR family transcriptional regulator [Actinomycetota bacterium]
MVENNSKINRSLLAEQIYETLKIRIMNGEYSSGFRLKERALAKEFEVSTVPVREALKLLWSQGFVNVFPYKGAEVVDVRSAKYAKDIYETRTMIECFCIEKAIKNTNPKIIKKIEYYLNELKRLNKKEDYESNFIDFDFHRAIVEAADNPYILKIFDSVKFKSPYYDKGVTNKNYERHKKIFDCIVAKDFEKAKQEIINHLTHFIKPMI